MSKTRNVLSAVAIAVLTATSFDNSLAKEDNLPSKEKAARIVLQEAQAAGVPGDLALAMAKVETNLDCSVRGSAGERGVMQIKPATARSLGYQGKPSGLSDCRTGARYGMKYLREALDRANGDYCRAAGLYNMGIGNKKLTLNARKYCTKVARARSIIGDDVVAAARTNIRH